MSSAPFDPRSICNLMLDEAARKKTTLSNIEIQKLLYFAHSHFLIETGNPLVSGYFEAWQYGPVHPAAYKAFKAAGERPIMFRAERIEPLTGRGQPLPIPQSITVLELVEKVILFYRPLTLTQLLEISHAKGAPWHFIVDQARSTMAFGLRIPDKVIIDRFKFHKVSLGAACVIGDPREDAPFT